MSEKTEKPDDYAFWFAECPKVGCRIEYYGKSIVLEKTEPHVNRWGENSFILTWRLANGKTATSGLRGKSLTYSRSADLANE